MLLCYYHILIVIIICMGPNAGSHGMAASDFPAILKMVAEGRLKPQELVEREVSS